MFARTCLRREGRPGEGEQAFWAIFSRERGPRLWLAGPSSVPSPLPALRRCCPCLSPFPAFALIKGPLSDLAVALTPGTGATSVP